MRDLRGALRKSTLDASNLMLVSPRKIAEASLSLSNKFWSPIWQLLPILNDAYNKKFQETHFLHERLIWGTSSFLNKAGVPLDPKYYEPEVVQKFIKDNLPRNKIAEAEEVVPLILFLASEAASMMSGSCVPIDAGEGKAYVS